MEMFTYRSDAQIRIGHMKDSKEDRALYFVTELPDTVLIKGGTVI